MSTLDCSKYVLCYKSDPLSQALSMIFLFVMAVILMVGIWYVEKKLDEKIKKNKKLKKKFYD